MRNDYLKDWDAWNRVAAKLYYRAKTEAAPREVDELLRLLERLGCVAEPGLSRILDVGAGWGRHSIELAKRGFGKVVAIDASPYMGSLFRREADSSGIHERPAFIVSDFLEYPEEERGCFDLVLVLWSMFGVCQHDDVNCALLDKAARLLKPGGRIVIETVLKDKLHAVFRRFATVKPLFTFDLAPSWPQHWEVVTWQGGRWLILGSAELTDEHSVFRYRLQGLPLHGAYSEADLVGGTIRLKYYDLGDLASMLFRAGFAVETVAGPLVDPQDRCSPRATVVARKLL